MKKTLILFIIMINFSYSMDCKTRLSLRELACNLHHGNSCSFLGESYLRALCTKQDKNKAIEFFKKACDYKNAEGCTLLGFVYMGWYNRDQDIDNAIKFLKKACDYGDENGCINLKTMQIKKQNLN